MSDIKISDSLTATPEGLAQRIEFLQNDNRLLLSDFQRTPESISSELVRARQLLDSLPQSLDNSIQLALDNYERLKSERDGKIRQAAQMLARLTDRAANGREIYRQQCEELDLLLQRRKATQNGNKIDRLKALMEEVEALKREMGTA